MQESCELAGTNVKQKIQALKSKYEKNYDWKKTIINVDDIFGSIKKTKKSFTRRKMFLHLNRIHNLNMCMYSKTCLNRILNKPESCINWTGLHKPQLSLNFN
jgi:hypothetical protein